MQKFIVTFYSNNNRTFAFIDYLSMDNFLPLLIHYLQINSDAIKVKLLSGIQINGDGNGLEFSATLVTASTGAPFCSSARITDV